MNGDDIRRSCRPGAPSHLRLVYNAVNVEQVRTYDVHKLADGARMDIRVLQGFDATDWNLGNVLSPWQGQLARITLRSADLDQRERLRAAQGNVELRRQSCYGAPAGGVHLWGRDVVALAAPRRSTRRVIAVLGVVKGSTHEGGEGNLS